MTYKVKCLVCGKEFESTHGSRRICSEECRAERSRQYSRGFYKKLYHEGEDERRDARCPVCGKAFSIGNHYQVYCSKACRLAAFAAERRRAVARKRRRLAMRGESWQWRAMVALPAELCR